MATIQSRGGRSSVMAALRLMEARDAAIAKKAERKKAARATRTPHEERKARRPLPPTQASELEAAQTIERVKKKAAKK